jgi:hypothetical protein
MGNGIAVTCRRCGKDFAVHPYRALTARYCSRSCHNAAAPLMPFRCEMCGTTFSRYASWTGRARFCSNECRARAMTLRTGEDAPAWKPKPAIICEWCGKLFEVSPCRDGKARFCSRSCRGKAHFGILSGAWRGGRSRQGHPPEFNKALRDRIHARDGGLCVLCGAQGRNVHHIDANKAHNHERNLVLLCLQCHRRAHRQAVEFAYTLFFQSLLGAPSERMPCPQT